MRTFLLTCSIAAFLLIGCEKWEEPPECKSANANCAGAVCADLYHTGSCDPKACAEHGGVDHWECD